MMLLRSLRERFGMNTAAAVLKQLMQPGNWISFPLKFLSVMSANEAVILGELINQWKITSGDGDDGFAYSQKAVEARTFMDKHAQGRALKKLKKAGYIETFQAGFPKRRMFIICWEALAEILAENPVAAEVQQPEIQLQRKCSVSRSGNAATDAAETQQHTTLPRSIRRTVIRTSPLKERTTPPSASLFDSIDGETDVPPEKDGADRLAERLCEVLLKKRKLMRAANLKKWSATLRRFLSTFKDPESVRRFDEVFNWYLEHVGDEFVPLALSATSFEEKFVRIEAAMRRSKNDAARPTANGGHRTKDDLLQIIRQANGTRVSC